MTKVQFGGEDGFAADEDRNEAFVELSYGSTMHVFWNRSGGSYFHLSDGYDRFEVLKEDIGNLIELLQAVEPKFMAGREPT